MELRLGLAAILFFVGGQGCPEVCKCSVKKKYGRHIIDCSYQDLQGVPAGFPSNATSISLSVNQITTLKKETFADVTELQALWLSHNEISTVARGAFASLVHLRALDLSHNQVRDFPWEDLANLTVLEQLKLSSNHLEKVPREAFRALRGLRALWLSDNRIAVLPEGVFDALPLLAHVQIDHNPLNCSCKLWWLQRWLETTSVSVPEKGSITCAAPENLSGLALGGSLKLDCMLPSVQLVYHSRLGSSVPSDKFTLLLHCHATGKPPPHIVWTIQTSVQSLVLHGTNGETGGINLGPEGTSGQSKGHFLVFRNGSLVISKFSKTDEGLYTCQATNEVGSHLASLKVALENSESPIDTNLQNDMQGSEPTTKLCYGEELSDLDKKIVVVYLAPVVPQISSSRGCHWELWPLGGLLLLSLAICS